MMTNTHETRTRAMLSRTGGEIMHPDHYDIRQALRDAVLAACDDVAVEHASGKAAPTDADLPEMFRAIDAWANKIFLRSNGLKA